MTHLRHAVLYDLLAGQIGLVADKELVDALGGVTVDLLQPLLDVRESVCVLLSIKAMQPSTKYAPLSVTSYTTMIPCAPR